MVHNERAKRIERHLSDVTSSSPPPKKNERQVLIAVSLERTIRAGLHTVQTPFRHPSETSNLAAISFQKRTATVAFRESGNKCGTVAGKVIL
jgi:hypothetical protein